jgi:hypothetical protein
MMTGSGKASDATADMPEGAAEGFEDGAGIGFGSDFF